MVIHEILYALLSNNLKGQFETLLARALKVLPNFGIEYKSHSNFTGGGLKESG